jgi:hypothetical protein
VRKLTSAQLTNVSEFLKVVARRKSKPGNYFLNLRSRYLANPEYKVVKFDDGTERRFSFAVAEFRLLMNNSGRFQFAILSDGRIARVGGHSGFSTPKCACEDLVLPIPYSVTKAYIEDESHVISKDFFDTLPAIVPRWAFRWCQLMGGLSTTFELELRSVMLNNVCSGLVEELDYRELVVKFLVRDYSVLERPLGSFAVDFEAFENSHKHFVGKMFEVPWLLKSAIESYINRIERPWEHEFPVAPVWQISLKDVLARYIAETKLLAK